MVSLHKDTLDIFSFFRLLKFNIFFMQRKLNQAFHELEAVKNEIINLIKAQSNEQLNKAPAANKWTILQITAHLMSSENKSLIYMKKKIQAGNNLPASTIASAFRAWLLRFFLKSPVRVKAPPVLDIPEPYYEKDVLIQQWNDQRKELSEFLAQLPPEVIQHDLFKHPVAGRKNVIQALRFMSTHATRHYNQMKDIIESAQ